MHARLRTIPTGIAGMYELMLRRLFNDSKSLDEMHYHRMLRLRKRILLWIATGSEDESFSPPTIRDIQYACVTVDGKTFDPENIPIPTTSQILEACGPLVEMDTESSVGGEPTYLRFSHRTVREFLCTPPEKPLPDAQDDSDQAVTNCMIPSEIEAHASIALTCCKFLNVHLLSCT